MKKLKNKLLLLAPVALASAPVLAVSAQASTVRNVNASEGVNSNESGVNASAEEALATKKTEYKKTVEALVKTEEVKPFLSAAQIEVYKAKVDSEEVTSEQVDQFLAEANELAAAMLVLSQNASSDLYAKLQASTRYESKVSDAEDASTYKAQLTDVKTKADAAISESAKSDSTLTTKDAVNELNSKFDQSYNKGVVSVLDVILNGEAAPVVNSVVSAYLKALLANSNAELEDEGAKLSEENRNVILTADASVDKLVEASAKIKEFADANVDFKADVANILSNSLISQEDKDELKNLYDKLISSIENKEDATAGEMYVKNADAYKSDLEALAAKYTTLKAENEKTASYDDVLSEADSLNDAQRAHFANVAKATAEKSEDAKDLEIFTAMVNNVNSEMVLLRENLNKYQAELNQLKDSSDLPKENKDAIVAALAEADEFLTKLNTDATDIQRVATNLAREYSKAKEVSTDAYKTAEANKKDPKPTYYEYIAFGAVSAVLLLAGLFIALFAKKRKNKSE